MSVQAETGKRSQPVSPATGEMVGAPHTPGFPLCVCAVPRVPALSLFPVTQNVSWQGPTFLSGTEWLKPRV
jgi:hypothetical protein